MTIIPLRIEHKPNAYKDKVGDRSKWPKGPWNDEPDLVEWRDEATGYPCLIVRGPMGAWCGYVGVPPEHPWHGKHYNGDHDIDRDDAPADHVHVHGGLTYSDQCAGSICHVARPGEPEHVWWFGFDCAHSGDVAPGLLAYSGRPPRTGTEGGLWDETYKTLAYVQSETTELAASLRQYAVTPPR